MTDTIFFMDRDGTINIDTDHVFNPDTVRLIEGASTAVAKIKSLGFKTVIISNQSCISRGMATISQVDQTMNRVKELLLLENKDAIIDLVVYSSDHPSYPTKRRKPDIGMILETLKVFPNSDLSKSYMIGDKISDPLCGFNSGIPAKNCILVKSNNTESEMELGLLEKAKELGFTVDQSLLNFVSSSFFSNKFF